jgi:DNA polymerase IV (DinB-like DNA polymerase)
VFGISSGIPISTAFRLCPTGIFLPVRKGRYLEVSRAIMECIQKTGYPHEQVSVDEAYLDLTSAGSYEKARQVCQDLKEEIFTRFHLTCSIGIAPSRSYAKIASEQKKPNGLFVIEPKEVVSVLDPLSAQVIPGIGKKSILILQKQSIETVADLRKLDRFKLADMFGAMAKQMYIIIHGREQEGLSNFGSVSSISTETTFLQDTDDENVLLNTLFQLTERVHSQMVKKGFSCRTVALKIRYTGFITRTHAITLPHQTRHVDVLHQEIVSLFETRYEKRPVRLVGVRLSGFDTRSFGQCQLDDFFETKKQEK